MKSNSLLSVAIAVVLTVHRVTFSCPFDCLCTYHDHSTSLTINCQGRTGIDPQQLAEQIDYFLSSNLTHDPLTSLRIVNSSLTNVPRSVCRLTSLTQLSFVNNRLTGLPDNCFPHLTNLTSLIASRNKIYALQDGLFDGLQQLVSLDFSENRISQIGLRLFSNESQMINLRRIDLWENNLTSVEPWPLVRVQFGTEQSPVRIRLDLNRISASTNEMQWKVNCSAKAGYGKVEMSSNQIRRIMDIAGGWGFQTFSDLFCLIRFHQGIPSVKFFFSAQTFVCDCIDYPLYSMVAAFPFSDLLQNCYCDAVHSPFYYVEIPKIPLDQFVCEVTERCPSGCRCVHRPANASLEVYCSNTNLTELPRDLPELPKSYTKYKLDVSNNHRLRRLEHRNYFVNTSVLDVTNCGIDEIPLDIWKNILRMKRVMMDGNSLKSLPPAVASSPLVASLSLERNPWACSCDNRWISGWMRSINQSLQNVDGLLCSTPSRLRGKNIFRISDEEFCRDPIRELEERTRTVAVSLASFAGVVIVLILVGIIVYRLRVKMYTRWKIHPFDRDECLDEDMNYDVFLSGNSDDNLPHVNGIREQLEQHGYRVCYPPRDFLAGELILDNIYNAIVHSKRTVCFLTVKFIQRLAILIYYVICVLTYSVFRASLSPELYQEVVE